MRLEPDRTSRAVYELQELGIQTNECVLAETWCNELHP
jgi:hypothetical protein